MLLTAVVYCTIAATVGAVREPPLRGLAFADLYTQDGKPCPPECVSDSMEIVTWYPSPYNEYEELRLYPKRSSEESQCNSFERLGLMYYNQDEQALKMCRQDPNTLNYSWQKVDGAGVPSGAVMSFNLSNCPAGWSELTAARGRYVVGLPSGGTLAGTQGTALSNLEDRPVGQHTHMVNDSGHSHVLSEQSMGQVYVGGCSGPNSSLTQRNCSSSGGSSTGITINNSGTISGTNAPYIQLLLCQKD